MASPNYILINGTATRLNSQVRLLVDALQSLKNSANALDATLGQANLDGATALATDLGLGSDDAATVYSLIHSAASDINASSFISQLLSRCG